MDPFQDRTSQDLDSLLTSLFDRSCGNLSIAHPPTPEFKLSEAGFAPSADCPVEQSLESIAAYLPLMVQRCAASRHSTIDGSAQLTRRLYWFYTHATERRCELQQLVADHQRESLNPNPDRHLLASIEDRIFSLMDWQFEGRAIASFSAKVLTRHFNALSQLAIEDFGRVVVVHYWKAARQKVQARGIAPAQRAAFDSFEITRTAEIVYIGSQAEFSYDEFDALQHWVTEFIHSCSLVVQDFVPRLRKTQFHFGDI